MRTRLLLTAASIALLAVLLYYSDLPMIVSAISRANPMLIAAGFAVAFFSLGLRVFRWKLYLKGAGEAVSYSNCAYSYMPSLFLSNLTPARVGEPVRSYFLKRLTGISMLKSIPAVVIERVMDVLSLVVISLLFVAVFGEPQFVYIDVALVAVIIIGVLVVLKSERLTAKAFGFLFSRDFVKKMSGREVTGKEAAQTFYSGVRMKGRYLATTFLLSLAIWGLEGLIFFMAFLSLGLGVPLVLAASAFAISVLVGLVTLLPGGSRKPVRGHCRGDNRPPDDALADPARWRAYVEKGEVSVCQQ